MPPNIDDAIVINNADLNPSDGKNRNVISPKTIKIHPSVENNVDQPHLF